ncbi:MAG: uroporphyrinogen decarboxylase [Pirellulaceae bacterium]|nr:uroporphyrinogen decarboxylase [Pirellulaceae bacterium]
MNDSQWQTLLRVIDGELVSPLPVGLIIDSPWLPQWAGISILDYFHDPELWFEANLRAVKQFERILFLPGFWSEYGMCTEPSAFGARTIFWENAFPAVEKILHDYDDIDRMVKPDCQTNGLLPLVLKRLVKARPAIERIGHQVRFAVARGPLNIASYLLGHTEFLMGVRTDPDKIHKLLTIVTEFLVDWIGLQADTFDSIDGIFLLDDVIGFLGNDDFADFVTPYMKAVFESRDVSVRFLHNDAHGRATAKNLDAMGVNLFNFSFNHSMAEMREWAGDSVTLLGNIPPRDVLATGTPEEVRQSVVRSLEGLEDLRRIILSCGGGAPPAAPTENIVALCEGADLLKFDRGGCIRDLAEESI